MMNSEYNGCRNKTGKITLETVLKANENIRNKSENATHIF